MKVWVVSHLEDPLLCPFTTVMLAHMFEHCIGAHTHTHTRTRACTDTRMQILTFTPSFFPSLNKMDVLLNSNLAWRMLYQEASS